MRIKRLFPIIVPVCFAVGCEVAQVAGGDASVPSEDASGTDAPTDAPTDAQVPLSPDVGADASVDDAAVVDAEATVESVGVACDPDDGAPPGSTCSVLRVSCSGIEPLEVELRDSAPTAGPEIGVVILGSGGNGTRFSSGYRGVTRELRGSGYRVIERRWRSARASGWLEGGMAEGACRYAALVRWIRQEIASEGEPVCVSGNSGGAGEIGAALTRQGLDHTVALAVMTSGPMARVDYACGRETDWEPVCTPLVGAHEWTCESGASVPSCGPLGPERALFDDAYLPETSACSAPTEASLDRLAASSPAPPGAALDLATDVRILVGANDCSIAPAQALLFGSLVTARGAPIPLDVIVDAPHELPGSPSGQPELLRAIREGCVSP